MDLVEGQSEVTETIVRPEMTASAVADRAGERYPAVLSTPCLIGEMERTAAAILQPILAGSEVSVGAVVEIKHFAPTPVGASLRTHARFTGRDEKLFWFEVWSEDPAGIVGKGRHGRAIVAISTIEASAATRLSLARPIHEKRNA
jgi:predicted thioesterase